MASQRVRHGLLAWMCAVVCGCASTIDGSRAATLAADAGIPLDMSVVDTGVLFDAAMVDARTPDGATVDVAAVDQETVDARRGDAEALDVSFVDSGPPADAPAPCPDPTMICGTVPAPRPIAPLSTATTTSQQPTLHWQLAMGTDGALVQICHDRACAEVEQTLAASGSSVMPATSLAAGVHFWRLFGRNGTTIGTVAAPTWEFFVGHRSAPVDTSWGSVLDVNGDGYADLVVAEALGTALVYPGSSSGLSTTPQQQGCGLYSHPRRGDETPLYAKASRDGPSGVLDAGGPLDALSPRTRSGPLARH